MESASDARRGFVAPGTGDSLQAANSAMVNWVGGGDSHRVLVVVDAAKDQHSSTALDWTLDHVVQRGDDLRLLAVLQQIYNPSKGGFQGGLSKCKQNLPVLQNLENYCRSLLGCPARTK